MRYWKVICKYGHVGKRKEISVARYIQAEDEIDIIAVFHIASDMPAVKTRGVSFIKEINYSEYFIGKQLESENPYLQKLLKAKPIESLHNIISA
jgi:hypothetical protein